MRLTFALVNGISDPPNLRIDRRPRQAVLIDMFVRYVPGVDGITPAGPFASATPAILNSSSRFRACSLAFPINYFPIPLSLPNFDGDCTFGRDRRCVECTSLWSV